MTPTTREPRVGVRPARPTLPSSVHDRAAPEPAPRLGTAARLSWVAIYGAAIVVPFLLVGTAPRAEDRTFTHELGSALGISVLVVLAMQLVLPARLRLFAPLGADVAVRLHRRLATIVLGLTGAHVLVIVLADPARLALLRFVDAPLRAQAAISSVVAMLLLFGSSLARRRVRLSYPAWRGIHLGLGGAALVLALIHTIGVHRYLVSGPAVVALSSLMVVPFASLAALRVPRLRRSTVRPYTVVRVADEGGGVSSLHLEAEGHAGQPFHPGQFAWIRLAGVRSSLDDHPFSYASSARRPDRPVFAIRRQRGFTARVPDLAPGTRLLVDGPHGPFRHDPDAQGVLIVAGGIGITPAMSILRTAWDDQAPGRFLLVYAARTPDALTFMDHFDVMALRLDVQVVPVISDPSPGWDGERGRIRAEVLDRYLPRDVRLWQFTVCGPPGLVEATSAAFGELGIPPEHVHAERFVEV